MSDKFGESLSDLKNTGINHNINAIVEQWIKVYTVLSVQPLDYYVDKGMEDVLNNLEDLVIPNLLSTAPEAQKELDDELNPILEKMKDYVKENNNPYYLGTMYRIYDQKSRDKSDSFHLNEKQLTMIRYRKQYLRRKFRKLNELARQMFIANNKEVYNK
jgi:hypothetical protein